MSPEERTAILEAIYVLIEDGMPLAEICRLPGFPNRGTVTDWEGQDEAVAQRIARARRHGHDVLAANCLKLARTVRELEESEEGEGANGRFWKKKIVDNVARTKLEIETTLKLLSKWDPRYAESVRQEISGPGGGPVAIGTIDTADAQEAARQYATMMALTPPST